MDDLIRRQDAIDALNYGAELLKRVLDETYVVGDDRAKYEWGIGLIESCISDMEDLPFAQPEQRWIPVTERLPEEKTYVLILADTISGKMAKVSSIYKDSAGRNCWTTLDEYGKNLFDWQPTHWMPLPEPWKGEVDDQR